jgi:hypothetical protein
VTVGPELRFTYPLSPVTCHPSLVTCHLSPVTYPLSPVFLYPVPYASVPALQQETSEAILSRAEDQDLRSMLRRGQDDRAAVPRDLLLPD